MRIHCQKKWDLSFALKVKSWIFRLKSCKTAVCTHKLAAQQTQDKILHQVVQYTRGIHINNEPQLSNKPIFHILFKATSWIGGKMWTVRNAAPHFKYQPWCTARNLTSKCGALVKCHLQENETQWHIITNNILRQDVRMFTSPVKLPTHNPQHQTL